MPVAPMSMKSSPPPLYELDLVDLERELALLRAAGEEDGGQVVALEVAEGGDVEAVALPFGAGGEVLGGGEEAEGLGEEHDGGGLAVAPGPEGDLLLGGEVGGGEGDVAGVEHGAGPAVAEAGVDDAADLEGALAAVGAALDDLEGAGGLAAGDGVGGELPAGAEIGRDRFAPGFEVAHQRPAGPLDLCGGGALRLDVLAVGG